MIAGCWPKPLEEWSCLKCVWRTVAGAAMTFFRPHASPQNCRFCKSILCLYSTCIYLSVFGSQCNKYLNRKGIKFCNGLSSSPYYVQHFTHIFHLMFEEFYDIVLLLSKTWVSQWSVYTFHWNYLWPLGSETSDVIIKIYPRSIEWIFLIFSLKNLNFQQGYLMILIYTKLSEPLF